MSNNDANRSTVWTLEELHTVATRAADGWADDRAAYATVDQSTTVRMTQAPQCAYCSQRAAYVSLRDFVIGVWCAQHARAVDGVIPIDADTDRPTNAAPGHWWATVRVYGQNIDTREHFTRADACTALASMLGRAYGDPLRRTDPDYEYTLGQLHARRDHGHGTVWVADPGNGIEGFVIETAPIA